jgi:aspartyl-tRNA(Asn)/glutamyl-tRNA(Gln) amidotransferase subunit A
MTGATWTDDACSLVDAFRRGERSPREELESALAAIETSALNAFSFVDRERALEAAEHADVSRPFGGVPVGVKELEPVAGWPQTEASLVFRDRVADRTSTVIERLLGAGGAVPVGLTTASEFGGLNVSVTKLNGVTHNPWRHGRTVGGSSAGSAAAVAGAIVPLATGGDGGGSIRIPAGYTGLLGMKGTYGRIPRGPHAYFRPGTIVLGCLARSVRDAARYFDVCAGYDPLDPSSLPARPGWEAGLGTNELEGRRVAVVPALGGVTLEPGVEQQLRASASALIAHTGMVEIDLSIEVPNFAAQWMMGNLATLLADLGDRWPRCADDLTDELTVGLLLAQSIYNLHSAAVAEELRIRAYEAMAAAFADVDFVISATNPGPAFAADATMSNPTASFIDWAKANKFARLGFRGVMGGVRLAGAAFPKLPSTLLSVASERFPDLVHMGALTIISNIYGNPAVSIPSGFVDGLPVGMQVLARHHADELLFDVALAVERTTPWPLVAPPAASDAPGLPELGDVENAPGEVGIDLRGEVRDGRPDVGRGGPTGPVEVGAELHRGVLGPDGTGSQRVDRDAERS